MKLPIFHHLQHWFVLLGLLTTWQRATAQFAEVTAEITIGRPSSPGYRSKTQYVVGTNLWRMDRTNQNGMETVCWFTGTNVNERNTWAPEKGSSSVRRSTSRSFESLDGNPGRPERVRDLLTDMQDRIGWLAFCSSACFKNESHKLFPPGSFWKHYLSSPPTGFSERVELFKDALGLPKSLGLYTANHETVFHYRVDASTNVLGWEFPLEFALTEYRPSYPGEANCWQTDFFATGKLTGIRVVSELKFSNGIDKAAEN